ncbi:hypothetical protein ZIOFF_064578 [Zingiber officinale]|uniref:Protein FAR1-RELATED SEQUENCE n=1 Tax=Zingiber officinale TaxID=94328 RepID=A0A8J5EW95_ZINOF|nr:hypothetical protein ZIOFF_064578 [Zingiber officinale]
MGRMRKQIPTGWYLGSGPISFDSTTSSSSVHSSSRFISTTSSSSIPTTRRLPFPRVIAAAVGENPSGDTVATEPSSRGWIWPGDRFPLLEVGSFPTLYRLIVTMFSASGDSSFGRAWSSVLYNSGAENGGRWVRGDECRILQHCLSGIRCKKFQAACIPLDDRLCYGWSGVTKSGEANVVDARDICKCKSCEWFAMRKSRAMLNDYNDPSERRSLSLDDTSSTEESQDDTRLSLEPSTDVIPYIGQKFETHDTAYEFYSKFAKRCGFSIRRHRTEGKDGIGKGLTRRYFVCHRAGNTPVKATSDTKSQRNRKSSRCGCQAYMRISRNIDMGVSEWRVTGFANHHNHELLEPNQVRFLPAYRTISDADKLRIQMFAKSGISVQQMMRLMELEKHVEPGYLPFTEKDVRNLIQSFRKVSQNEEGIDLLRMCKSIKEKEPNFKYDFTLDQNNMLTGIAWSYASSVQSYEIFGDAVVFDTTHRLAAFDLPLGIWVGMNNYGMPCFFGCVLLQEENVQSFTWALKVFLNFMNGKAPRTILTDQNTCLREAISVEMPKTKHALCVWLTMAKFPSWFNSVLGERYNEWKVEFYRLYNLERPDDFEHGWREMVSSFGLHSNRHIANLFTLRTQWALPYLRSHFLAGLTLKTTSKSVNAFIQRFLSAQSRLAHFVEQV